MPQSRSTVHGPRWRMYVLIVACALTVVACGGGSNADAGPGVIDPVTASTPGESIATGSADQSSTDAEPGDAAVDSSSPDGAVSTTVPADPDTPAAPDFTLELGEGGEFALSAESRPVYLVFWAEW